MRREPWHRLTSRVGRWAVEYLDRVPAHRGQSRIIHGLGRALGPVPLRCAGGAELLVRLDSAMDRSYVRRGQLDHPELLAEIARLRPGDTMVDVGANAGLYSVLAAQAVFPGGRVLAFEPSADEFARLAWAVAANGAAHVIAQNVALSDRAGFVGFVAGPSDHTGLHRLASAADLCPGNPASATSPSSAINLTNPAAPRVWAERGDRAIMLREGEHIALMKIDVEGAELSVLRGLAGLLEARRIDRLVVEITDEFLRRFGASASELYAYLQGFGYTPLAGARAGWQYDAVFARDAGVGGSSDAGAGL